MSSPDSILQSVFGFDSFRPGQEPIIDYILGAENVLALVDGRSKRSGLSPCCIDG